VKTIWIPVSLAVILASPVAALAQSAPVGVDEVLSPKAERVRETIRSDETLREPFEAPRRFCMK
jgi:hypothetical protein